MCMKKLMMSLLMLTACSVQGFAADLLGKWKTTMNDDGNDMLCEVTINANDLVFAVTVSEEDDEMGTLAMLVEIPGSYTRDGKNLRINLQKDRIDIKLKEFKPKNPELKKLLEEDPKAKDAFMVLIESMISAYKDQMMGEGDILNGKVTIKELTATTLTLEDEDDKDIIFTRVQ